MTMPIDDLDSLLIMSYGGLSEGYQATPLRKFRGKLIGWTTSRTKTQRIQVNYNFTDLDPTSIEATETYNFPIAQIPVMFSGTKKSAHGILLRSIQKILETVDTIEDGGLNELLGRMQTWQMTPDHMLWDGREGKDMPRECWEVVEVEAQTGAEPEGSSEAVEKVLDILDGKTLQQFNQEVFKDPIVKKDNKLKDTILSGTLVPMLVATGKATIDGNGVHHKI